ncbi:aminotransferase class III-fold pyridoxal phosphate-dependent enzyme [Geovibrio thiophilus]|uniref:Aminotransferase class III-fold pyridoxal phosphate-dependent enzyme n=1 Tax=Geovibrio thiophilus TaxID=139438 RepID=A0A3R5UVZ4_9BACT|nr:aminotransferase class III-fold pyridoxal phosphate-dependent enzyme [Geovibrio thiophilus]QAR31873.1 aminotransferase class III-fold pyridoxal phosphate-dependent enzyme [Geovibrio thiophilus]
MSLFDKYSAMFPLSEREYGKALELFPGGVCHDIRRFEPFPFVTDSAEGAYLQTIDGVTLLDLWCGHYGNILGHASTETAAALREAAENGTHTGTLNEQQIKLASLIKSAVSEMELMRFCTSGTEATMYAVRTAKAYTGRELIVKIEGGWHGANSELSYDIKPPFNRLTGTGGTISLPFNNMEATADVLEKVGDNAAAIIIEPVIGAGGGIPAKKEYLQMLREFCDRTGTVLIFDEVITGFRFRFGSVSPLLGVTPDMFTMGKIIGGGLAIGAYGGRREIMRTITDKKIVVGGGTFSASPVTMNAGFNTLSTLKKADYSLLNSAGDNIRERIKTTVCKYTDKACVTGFGSFFFLHFLNEVPQEVTCRPSRLLPAMDSNTERLFKIAMILNGVFTMHSGGALSFAHLKTEKLSDTVIKAYENSLEAVFDERRQTLP